MVSLDKRSWLFPAFFKLAASKNKDVDVRLRCYGILIGTGLLIVEPVVKICNKLGLIG